MLCRTNSLIYWTVYPLTCHGILKVREIMKPRVEVVAVPRTMSVASVLGVVRESGYSRIPVCKSSFCLYMCFVFSKSTGNFFHHTDYSLLFLTLLL